MSNSNNSSLIVIAVAAIMVLGALGGALAIAVGSNNGNNNVNVQYAPESSEDLWAYANELCSADSDKNTNNEIVLYESLLGDSFMVNGKLKTIDSVESFRTYLVSLGYLVEMNDDINRHRLIPYEIEYSSDAAVLCALSCVEFSEEAYLDSLRMTAIDTMTASTFANQTFAKTMPDFGDTDGLIKALSDVDSDTQLYEFFGGFAYEATYTEEDGTLCTFNNIIRCAFDLRIFLTNFAGDVDWEMAEIWFESPSDDVSDILVTGEIFKFEKMDLSSERLTTTGDLLDYIYDNMVVLKTTLDDLGLNK